ncbi:hypothetical protein [Bacteroides sp.]|uniref:hypothetical protein n=1 Tax=Bacteroides sp. TaxID=29523 RepID=UPI001B76104E|nr:hypothetical protein [Bacteroides sp.]MBP6065689.1 hypothetical protein [Bacteroides sp.]MBP6068581.1 hypothetical protein [Bacteroides sp.]MBP6936831.1 hypothetical protein [Bacteroides sp.]MBP8622274.1 hypothetical protein [Bacteroides sp.]MBP9587086.1 hypothetical protein [Bacteroides sp.]
MEQQLTKTVKILKSCYKALWALPIAYIVLGETDLIPVGSFVDDVRASYFVETACILLTALSVPLSLKLFGLVLHKKIDTYTFPVALSQYQLWSIIRLAILGVSILFCLTGYYLTLSSTGALCAFIGLTASLFCIPGEKKLRQDLHIAPEPEPIDEP